MNTLKIPYKTPRQLCEAVSKLETVKELNFTRRPKFRFKPDESSWWLVPGTDNPHYHLRKYFFSWNNKEKTELRTGFHIEKGLDQQLKAVFSSRQGARFIMDERWDWNRFIQRLQNNSFLSELKSKLPEFFPDLIISIDGGYVTEPTKFDPYQDKNLGWDSYSFIWDLNNNNLSLDNFNRKAFALKLHNVKTIENIREHIIKLNEDPWLWLNFYITFPLAISNPEDKNNLDTAKLWNNCLSKLNFS